MSRRYRWRPHVTVAASRAKADRVVNELRRKGEAIEPVELAGSKIASTFWGKAWCEHLESFSDYENRLPRGRRYVKNGAVCHLSIQQGRIDALVSGSKVYSVRIDINTMPEGKWRYIQKRCTGRIGSLMELLDGRFSDDVMRVVTDRQEGLFPLPGEISLHCSCPDWAVMCKHVAAVLYGVGARLDRDPSLLFRLRNVDHELLLQGEAMAAVASAVETGGRRQKLRGDVSEIFGIELDDVAETPEPDSEKKKPPGRKATRAKTKVASARKSASKKGAVRVPGLNTEQLMAEVDGAWIKNLRARAGEMPKSRFAKVLGIAPSTVTAWERRKKPIKLTEAHLRRLNALLPNSRAPKLSSDKQLVADAVERWACGRFELAPRADVVDGEFVRRLRESFDMPLPVFSALVGVRQDTAARWEERATPLPKSAYKRIVAVMSIDIGEAWDRVINR